MLRRGTFTRAPGSAREIEMKMGGASHLELRLELEVKLELEVASRPTRRTKSTESVEARLRIIKTRCLPRISRIHRLHRLRLLLLLLRYRHLFIRTGEPTSSTLLSLPLLLLLLLRVQSTPTFPVAIRHHGESLNPCRLPLLPLRLLGQRLPLRREPLRPLTMLPNPKHICSKALMASLNPSWQLLAWPLDASSPSSRLSGSKRSMTDRPNSNPPFSH